MISFEPPFEWWATVRAPKIWFRKSIFRRGDRFTVLSREPIAAPGCSRFSFIASAMTGASASALRPPPLPEPEVAQANLTQAEPISEFLTDDDILAALDRLPTDFRAIVLIVDAEDFSYKDASQILSIPLGTVNVPIEPWKKAAEGAVGRGCPALRTNGCQGRGVNPTPPNNRLKDAVNNVPVPDDLVASVRSLIRAQASLSGAWNSLKSRFSRLV
jgi:Sigma-70, region 4